MAFRKLHAQFFFLFLDLFLVQTYDDGGYLEQAGFRFEDVTKDTLD